jgi:secreted trypsin-like serine protease
MKYLFLVLIGAFCSVGAAQDNYVPRHVGGGVIVPQSKYPAVIQIEVNKSNGKTGYCSATIVGPRTILTAAHCGFQRDEQNEDFVSENTMGTFEASGKKYKFKFIPHAHLGAELLNRSKLDVALGYGCTWHLSETIVKNREQNPLMEDSIYRFLVSADDSITTFACPGDSGGPTLAYNSEVKLRISSIQIRRTDETFWDVRTSNIQFISFIADIVQKNNLKVCGYNMECD